MRYTKYIQQCLAVLEQEREYDTDMRLVTLVRVQHLTERIAQLNAPDDPAEEIVGLPAAPLSAYVSAFHNELDRIRNGLPPELTNDSEFYCWHDLCFWPSNFGFCRSDKHVSKYGHAPVI